MEAVAKLDDELPGISPMSPAECVARIQQVSSIHDIQRRDGKREPFSEVFPE